MLVSQPTSVEMKMVQIIDLRPRLHARASEASLGQISGLSSLRETPVSLSIDNTNSAGTPRLERVSQYQTCDCVVPIRSARGFCPPAAVHARRSASVDVMDPHYPDLGQKQPKTLWGTTYRNFGNFGGMREPIDPKKFGERVKELRTELGMSQAGLGKASGFSQSNIGWIEAGSGKDPKKQALALADALGSSPEWLLHGTGVRQTGIRPLTKEQLSAIYDNLPLSVRMAITETVKTGEPSAKKRAAR